MPSLHLSPRRGAVLVEALASITVLTVGVLAVASTSASIVRLEAAAARRALAASVVASRLETLHASGCRPTSGADTMVGLRAYWHVAPIANAAEYSDSVIMRDQLGRLPRVEVIRSGGPC